MRYSISDTAEFGDLTRGPRVIDEHVRARMRGLLDDIRSGAFAKEWIEEMDTGEPRLRELREQAAAQPMEQVGKELRALMRREETEVRAG
jgi:ketol-acid reductoisomerase